MKKNLIILLLAAMAVCSCQKPAKMDTVNIDAEKAIIDSLFEKFDQAFIDKDVNLLSSFLTEDVLCMGTDPSEMWNKQQVTDAWKQMAGDSVAVKIDYISDRNIRIASDGHSAIVADQYIMPGLSPNIPWRNVYHLVKVDGDWKISVLNCAVIPKNEDIAKLNEALAVKE